MRFDGQVWFDFSTPAVWTFYRFVSALAEDGHDVNLEWSPLPTADEDLAMASFLTIVDPLERGRFLHAMLGLVHLEHADVGSPDTIERAARAAGVRIGADPTDTQAGAMRRLMEDASALGVDHVPALYRHGPAMAISLNGAALLGDLGRRAQLILEVVEDDGVWGLVKP